MQVFSYTADKEIRTDDLCLDVSRLNGPVIMLKCHHMRGNQLWEYDAEVQYFLNFLFNARLSHVFQIVILQANFLGIEGTALSSTHVHS